MVERYHELDDAVLRELFGKKVTSKTRKDLDDVSELTRVPLRSCHRQYDNIRRWVVWIVIGFSFALLAECVFFFLVHILLYFTPKSML